MSRAHVPSSDSVEVGAGARQSSERKRWCSDWLAHTFVLVQATLTTSPTTVPVFLHCSKEFLHILCHLEQNTTRAPWDKYNYFGITHKI